MSSEVIHDIIKQLKTDPSLREKFLDALEPDRYVRRDEFNELLNEIKQSRIESNERFKAMQRQMDERFKAMQRQMDERFRAVDKRFESLIDVMQQGFDSMKFYVDAQVNNLTGRYGHRVESALRKLGQEILKSKGYEPSSIESIRVIDQNGDVFGTKNYVTDVDLLYHDEETWIIEVKTRPTREALLKLSLLKKLLEKAYGMSITRVVLIGLSVPRGIEEEAENMGIEVWHALKEKPLFVPPMEEDEEDEDQD